MSLGAAGVAWVALTNMQKRRSSVCTRTGPTDHVMSGVQILAIDP